MISWNKFVRPPTVVLGLALLDHLHLPTVRLGLPAMRVEKTALPRMGEWVPLRRVKVRLLLVLHCPGLHLLGLRRLVLRRRLVHRLLVLRHLVLRRVVALRRGVTLVAVVVLRVVDLRGEVALHAVVVVRRVGVVLVTDEVLRRRVLLPDRLRSNRTPKPSAKSVVFRTHSP